MKFTRTQISILLIFLIGLSNISSASLSIKSNRARSKSHSKRNKIKTRGLGDSISRILSTASEKLLNLEHISFFLMGIFSTWIKGLVAIQPSILAIPDFFKPCQDELKVYWDMMNGASVETDPAKKTST